MKSLDKEFFHKLYGQRKPRITYFKKDFLDYSIMSVLTVLIVFFAFGPRNPVSAIALFIGLYSIIAFSIRHGVRFRVPIILTAPQNVLFAFIYKIQNIKPVYLLALVVLLLENYVIYLTPSWPHKVDLMRQLGFGLLYLHLFVFFLYRTAILVALLKKKKLVHEFLCQTSWKSFLSKQPVIELEIIHAYFSGLLTHIVFVVPWYLVLKYFDFSILFIVLVVPLNLFTQLKYLYVHNEWFYRDHWLGHNSEVEFVYLHGTHHDAIPCGLIGVAGNGHLEGVMRMVGFPTQFFNPIAAFLTFSVLVKQDMDLHQYIPGVYPKLPRLLHEVSQHSTHHFGSLEPYSVGLKYDQPHITKAVSDAAKFPDVVKNSIVLDEQLSDFEWHSSKYRKYLALFDQYQPEANQSEENSD